MGTVTTHRQGVLGVSVKVTVTAQNLQSLIENILGIAAGTLGSIYRECTIQVDPETSNSLSVRIGNGNVGTTVTTTLQGSVVQKGCTLAGGSLAVGSGMNVNAVYIGTLWVQAVSGEPILNILLWEI